MKVNTHSTNKTRQGPNAMSVNDKRLDDHGGNVTRGKHILVLEYDLDTTCILYLIVIYEVLSTLCHITWSKLLNGLVYS